ncbi:hypothetical protein [Antrihabitans spumae]|uniref:Uncharacterized protein n=1 Tax=Antrihabitans spumae TaxID=3373370 RepID=A0ABW7KCR0_9NOCA
MVDQALRKLDHVVICDERVRQVDKGSHQRPFTIHHRYLFFDKFRSSDVRGQPTPAARCASYFAALERVRRQLVSEGDPTARLVSVVLPHARTGLGRAALCEVCAFSLEFDPYCCVTSAQFVGTAAGVAVIEHGRRRVRRDGCLRR